MVLRFHISSKCLTKNILKDDIGGMSRALARCFKHLTKIIEIEKPDFILSGFDIAKEIFH